MMPEIEKDDVVRYPTSTKLWEVTSVLSVPSRTDGSGDPRAPWLMIRALTGPSGTRSSLVESVVLHCKAADREARGLS